MPLFNVNQTVNNKVNDRSKVPIKDNQFLIVPDSGDIYYDFGGVRTKLSDIITLDTEQQRRELGAPYEKFYFVKDSGVLWRYNKGSWTKCSRDEGTPINKVLTVTAWSNNRQSVEIPGLTTSQSGIAGLSQEASVAERQAAKAASIYVCGQTDGAITVAIGGSKPTCDIPITVVLFG